MFEIVTAFIIYFVVIDPIGNAPIFLVVTEAQDRWLRTALEGTAIAAAIMLFFALARTWILGLSNITEAAFKIAGGIILFLVALDMLAAKRQQRKRAESTGNGTAGDAVDEEDSDGTIWPSTRWPFRCWPGRRPSCR